MIKRYITILFLLTNISLSAQNWTVNPANYEFSMNITGEVKIDNNYISSLNAELGVFVGSECRGTVKAETTSNGKILFFLSIYSNSVQNEELSFKIYIPGLPLVELPQTVIFKPNAVFGTPDKTFLWSYPLEYKSTDFLSFSFNEQIAEATINTAERTITIDVSAQADLTNLRANFEVPIGCEVFVNQSKQISGETANDFSAGLSYTLKGIDGATGTWQVNVTKAVGIEEIVNNLFKIYPNPCSDYLIIENKGLPFGESQITLYDMSGRSLKKFNWNENKTIIELKNFRGGYYFLKIENSQGIFYKKIQKL